MLSPYPRADWQLFKVRIFARRLSLRGIGQTGLVACAAYGAVQAGTQIDETCLNWEEQITQRCRDRIEFARRLLGSGFFDLRLGLVARLDLLDRRYAIFRVKQRDLAG